jgi:L-seryl-tRNA(Ser) seleniumtransferase
MPTLNIAWDIAKINIPNMAVILREGTPSIEVMIGPKGSINVTTHMLKPEQVKIVAARIKEELTRAAQ